MAKLKKYLLPPALIFGAIVIVVILANMRPEPPEREAMVTSMLVDVIEASESQGTFSVQAQGIVRPQTQTSISAEVGGRLVEIAEPFVAGGFFKAGEVLAQIDPSDYEAALLQAQAELASAEATLADETARSEQAKRDWERIHGSDREPNDLVLRLPQVARAKASVDAAKASVLRAERNLERTQIRLPYDGIVRARNVDLGQFVGAGTVLGVAFAIDVAEVRLPLSNQDRAFLNLPRAGDVGVSGPEVTLVADVDGQMGQWTGRVVRTEGVIDENTRLSYAVVAVDDPYQRLNRSSADENGLTEAQTPILPMGTFVEGTIAGRSATGLIELPRSALRTGDRVFVANDQDELEIRDVEVIRATTDEVYVRNSLYAGDRVIVTGITAPIPGSKLRIRRINNEAVLRLAPAPEEAGTESGDGS